jgi:hypothetical protein
MEKGPWILLTADLQYGTTYRSDCYCVFLYFSRKCFGVPFITKISLVMFMFLFSPLKKSQVSGSPIVLAPMGGRNQEDCGLRSA